ncbi:toll/interleukin-1 receptor domain-containing protein [Janibacter melonis]|uniref:toll/interleukin-1 receptor domain-containing protein n=1 Tax=Janibacter melonis TaxID=262209 RepID=UPI001967BB68|nr:toll/interleukin-1 receptor domain-containing protein [Janibacter melonis]
MPAPPILDVFVVWHPDDEVGATVFERVLSHFHSQGYSGLAGGAVEVYARSASWTAAGGPPRPLLLPGAGPGAPKPAQFVAIVPVLGAALRNAVERDEGWANYLRTAADGGSGAAVVVLPVTVPGVNLADSLLASVIGGIQRLPRDALGAAGLLEREIAQAIAQKAGGLTSPVRVFISHAKHFSGKEASLEGDPLYERVRSAIAESHLGEFFDAHDLLPGNEWATDLEANAGGSAMLMVRTDRYASREWTQREVRAAKQHDVPIVGLIALAEGEARGSFLMDHVPTVPLRHDAVVESISQALDRLVDEVLKRVLWAAQSTYIGDEGFDWTPVHAPEPVTAVEWLTQHRNDFPDDDHVLIIHPDPPLGTAERAVIDDLCTLAGFDTRIDILTPRTFAARGGVLHEG